MAEDSPGQERELERRNEGEEFGRFQALEKAIAEAPAVGLRKVLPAVDDPEIYFKLNFLFENPLFSTL
jgi:hypothetical protein